MNKNNIYKPYKEEIVLKMYSYILQHFVIKVEKFLSYFND